MRTKYADSHIHRLLSVQTYVRKMEQTEQMHHICRYICQQVKSVWQIVWLIHLVHVQLASHTITCGGRQKKKISVTLTRIFERRDMIYSRWSVPPSAFHRSPTVCRHATPSSMVFPPIEWNAAIFSVAHWRSAPMSLRSFQAVAFDADNSFRCKQNNSKCSIIFSYRFRWIVQIIIFYEPQWGHIRLPE